MAILSKACKPDNCELHNSLKLSFTNIWDLRLKFNDCKSFLESNSPDILALCEINLDDSIDSSNFSVMMVMMMNCFCDMVDQRKAFSLISSRDHCQRSSPSRISGMPRAVSEPAQSLSSGLVEWNCAVVITTTPQGPRHFVPNLIFLSPVLWKVL